LGSLVDAAMADGATGVLHPPSLVVPLEMTIARSNGLAAAVALAGILIPHVN
jgi:hypothetical protein